MDPAATLNSAQTALKHGNRAHAIAIVRTYVRWREHGNAAGHDLDYRALQLLARAQGHGAFTGKFERTPPPTAPPVTTRNTPPMLNPAFSFPRTRTHRP
jgi:hypothetical protein